MDLEFTVRFSEVWVEMESKCVGSFRWMKGGPGGHREVL